MSHTATSIRTPSRAHQPRARRTRRLAGLVAVVAAALVLTSCLNEQGERSFHLLNNERTSRGIPALTNDFDLNATAQQWSEHMAATGRMSHSRLTVPPGATRVAENVGYGPSVDRVHLALWNSSAHRANILDQRHTRVGIGAAVDSRGRVWITQIFAN
jgi:uncharacterized protein YkwD